jgi:lambda repressor-like predicted transcriptional regulator
MRRKTQLSDISLRVNISSPMMKKGLTAYALSLESGIPSQTIYNILNKPLKRVDLGVLSKIARVLGVSPVSFFEECHND